MIDRETTSFRMLLCCTLLSGASVGCTGTIGEQGGASDPDATPLCTDETAIFAGRAPIRRLTRFEYNNTVRDLLGDASFPGNAFPSEEIGNGFGNDADAQPVSSFLAEQYNTVAEAVANRVVATPAMLSRLAPCATEITAGTDVDTENACARTLVETLATRAYRRPLEAGELDELMALQALIRGTSDFPTSISAMIEAVLQSPDYLYRVEWGKKDAAGRLRPSGHEMATRLSFFLWGTHPDDTLVAAAAAGQLDTDEGVLAQATRLLGDERARPVIRFFFDNLLPISSLAALERDPARYPAFSGQIGAYMKEETHAFLQYEIFEGSGSWQGALTAPYTFVNGPLAEYYGIPGVTGDAFQKVDLDGTQRLGLLTQAGVVAGTIHSNETNPVTRGSFVVQKLMCRKIPLPTDSEVLAQVKPPNPDAGKTARERYSVHSEEQVCASCHQFMDPVGFAFENYDAVGQWRDAENGVTIDATSSMPGSGEATTGPVDMVRKIAAAEETQACFANNWMSFAYGRTLGAEDACTKSDVERKFAESGYDVRALLLALTQTDAFLYLPEREE